MRKEKPIAYQDVVFVDSTTGKKFVCGSTVQSERTEQYRGADMPVVVVPISSASHPFFVGGKQFVDAEGRVDRFKKRYQNVQRPQPPAEVAPVAKKATRKKSS